MSGSVSIVEYFSENSGSSCGYCKGKTSSFSHGLWGHVLTTSDYQDMIDRGWRRSGKYCYKPTMNKTCCPQYPIRCNVKEFVPRKSHRKIMKRFCNYIENNAGALKKKNMDDLPPLPDSKLKYDSASDNSGNSDDDSSENKQMQLDIEKADDVESKLKLNESKSNDSIYTGPDTSSSQADNVSGNIYSKNCETDGKLDLSHDVKDSKSKKHVKPGLGPDPKKPPARKSKDIRKERALLKKQRKGETSAVNPTTSAIKSSDHKFQSMLDQLTDTSSFPKDSKHKFEIKLLNAQTTDTQFMESFEESFQVYRKYQVAIHKDKPSKCTANQFTRFLCNSSLVREDKCNSEVKSASQENLIPNGFGAYHQQYLIDGKIVCVGVLDIMPHCVSSVYFYYDPEYSFLSLGTLSSLFEISYVRKLASLWRPELFYYYMGFYIHSCPKMRYKSQYHPSYLLCPETYEWIDVAKCTPKLDKSKYSRFNEDTTKCDANSKPIINNDLYSVHVLHRHEGMPYGMLVELRKRRKLGNDGLEDKIEVSEYASLAGIALARKMLLYRS